MIRISIPNRKEEKKWYYPNVNHSFHNTHDSSSPLYKEAQRKDAIIQEKFKACPYTVNDLTVPVSASGKIKYGDCRVRGICKSYAEFGKDVEWNDLNPMIVTAFSVKEQCVFFCTIDYLEKMKDV